MKKLLRISTFPTSLFPGAGLHPYQISKNEERYQIYYLHPFLEGDTFDSGKIVRSPIKMNMTPRPKTKLLNQLHFLFRRTLDLIRINTKAIFLILKNDISIVHIHSPMYMGASLFAKFIGKKNYITYHGSDFQRIKKSKLYRYLCFCFDHAFFIGADMKSGLSKIHGFDKITQVNNGIDLMEFTPPIENESIDTFKFCAVGSLKKEKGFDYLIGAFKHSSLNYSCNIAGNGNLKEELKHKIDKTKTNIVLVGHLNSDQVKEFYHSHEYFILSSTSEGFPKVLLEALASGCKIIATRVGSVAEILGDDYPFLCEPNSETDLKNKIEEICTQHDFDFEKHRTKTIEKFSWEKVMLPYLKYLK
ncbi:MAG: glycosyltransferase family 4 protein [Bdellovibrionales bacterium]